MLIKISKNLRNLIKKEKYQSYNVRILKQDLTKLTEIQKTLKTKLESVVYQIAGKFKYCYRSLSHFCLFYRNILNFLCKFGLEYQ